MTQLIFQLREYRIKFKNSLRSLCPRAYDKFVFTDHLYADNDGNNINSYKTFKNQYNGIADVSLLRTFVRAKKCNL